MYLYLKYMLMYLFLFFEQKNTKYILMSDIFRQLSRTLVDFCLRPNSDNFKYIYVHVHTRRPIYSKQLGIMEDQSRDLQMCTPRGNGHVSVVSK